ncbi:hypothetical protein QLQ12_19470 [Actinoplanes sp. NEAU-A12]|uniref:Secreted protein n=1 Tax=Actinoplanes sandaracinus TaxID=3045177 RepID=A0ABT6WM69_9ACTN|nr:hypothetical protein [Actinoplanes sandaracinus]MDI6100795.1 hypothetical protein [Actinoplanes sandaracinus]
MSRILRAVLLTVATLATALSVFAAPAGATPRTPYDLGAPDLGGYCQSQGYTDAVLTGSTAYDWHCRGNDNRQADISFDEACRWTYVPRNVHRIGTFSDPASVRCWFVSNRQGGAPDFTRYCRSQGFDTAVLSGDTAYDWHCRSSESGALADINVGQACFETYFGYRLDRFTNFRDPHSWECLL